MQRAAIIERHEFAYEQDVAAWADAQVELLRAERLDELDLANIIEEIEGVAKTERTALASQIARIAEHLLKLIYSPATNPRRGWVESILDARIQIERTLEGSPSLRRELDAMVANNVARQARSTAQILRTYDEIDASGERELLRRSFTTSEIIENWMPSGVDLGR